MLAEPAAEAGDVVVTATDLDDFTPEYLEPVRAELFEAGALDVQVWSTMAKKGRPSLDRGPGEPRTPGRHGGGAVRASTTGVRRWVARPSTLARHERGHDREGSAVRSVLEAPGGAVKPEYDDDVAAAARRAGRPPPDIVREVQQQAKGGGARSRPRDRSLRSDRCGRCSMMLRRWPPRRRGSRPRRRRR
jgi:uncharacterized protein (DUF111 family)